MDDFGAGEYRLQLSRQWNVALDVMGVMYTSLVLRDYLRQMREVVSTLKRLAVADNLDMTGIFNTSTWAQFRNDVQARMQEYADGTYAPRTSLLESEAIALGVTAAESLATAAAGPMAETVRNGWRAIAPDVLAQTAGVVNSPVWLAMISQFGADAATDMTSAATNAFAKGGFVGMFRALRNWPSVPLSWSASGSRTAQVWAYRRASHETYRANNHLLRGWVWVAALDSRVCPSCVAMHGTRHTLDETLNDHHQGRCTPVPIVIGSDLTDSIGRGSDWFDRQPADIQREIMGVGMLKAYREGRFGWDEVSRTYNDPMYGTMRRAATLRELMRR